MESKQCGTCKAVKSIEAFYFKDRTRGIYQHDCAECGRRRCRAHYERNKAAYVKRAFENRVAVQRWLWDYLSSHPCVDCGETDPIVLEFDHVRGKKVGTIARMVHHGSMRTVQEEVPKCDVRCANCHKRKTAKQFNWYKHLGPSFNG